MRDPHTAIRERRGLNGTWSFWPDILSTLPNDPADTTFVSSRERTAATGQPGGIVVPGAWQDQFEELHLWAGTAWYERPLDVPASWAGRRIRLLFGAVDYHATVWVNGVFVGSHEGGYLPFDLDVAHAVRPGEANTVTVRVIDVGREQPGDVPWPFTLDEVPHGKQGSYGPMGGIWQRVALEASAENLVSYATGHGDVDAAAGVLHIELAEPAAGGERIVVGLTAPDGLDVWTSRSDALDTGVGSVELRVDVDAPMLWEPEAPWIYTASIDLEVDGEAVDRTTTAFGFRTIEARDGRIWLNGNPIHLRGALDHDYLHVATTPAPTDTVFRQQIAVAKELGLNLLRCHIKAPDPRYLEWADRLGILVWEEVPSWGRLTPAAAERMRTTFEGMVRRDRHHPSVIAWTLVNEAWGLPSLVDDPTQRAWLRDTYRWAKGIDPTRLVVDNSPCEPNFHVSSDLNDFHWYRAVPEHLEEWQRAVSAWIGEPERSFGPADETERRGDEPLVVSEFGTWGLPNVGNLLDDRGQEPWWFAYRDQGDEHVAEATGVLERFSAMKLDGVFGSWEGFVAESQLHQFEALKAEIDDLRRRPEIAGYVVTQLTDVHWESNGLLDMARNPKVYHHRMQGLNAPDILAPRPTRWRVRAGDTVEVDVRFSHHSRRTIGPCVLSWEVPELALRDDIDVDEVFETDPVVPLPSVSFEVPKDLGAATRLQVGLTLRERFGRDIARGDVMLLAVTEGREAAFPVTTSDDTMRAALAERGWPIDPHGVIVARSWDETLERSVRDGARAVVFPSPGERFDGRTVRSRPGADRRWEGDWGGGMGWLRPELCAGLAIGPRVDMAFVGLTPEADLLGDGPGDPHDVLAGYHLGWVHPESATIVRARIGEGRAIACTFPLADRYGVDPLATVLLERLLALVATA